jgi:hypothetical protein
VDSKLLFGVLSIIPAVFAYAFYFKDIFAGKTKPHTFSWLIWGTLAANGFFAQVSARAGIGAWATGLTAIVSLTIFIVALFKGDRKHTLLDWSLLLLALFGFVLLFFVNDKTAALVITLLALTAGFAMTIRKAYARPDQETAKSFALNALKFAPSILALSSFTFLTVAYPFVALLGNAAIAWVIFARRRQLTLAAAKSS